MSKQIPFEMVLEKAHQYKAEMSQFLRDMIAIPSESCDEKRVVLRIKQEMEKVGFDKVEIEFASQYQCVGSGANTNLTTVGTDKTNLARTNALVVAGFTNWRSYGCSSVAMGRALLCVGTTGCGAFVPVHEADTERQNRS